MLIWCWPMPPAAPRTATLRSGHASERKVWRERAEWRDLSIDGFIILFFSLDLLSQGTIGELERERGERVGEVK